MKRIPLFVENLIFLIPPNNASCIDNYKFKSPFRGWGMKFTQNTLDKIEKIAEDCGYIIRYERGTFQSGYCILQDKKVVVLNKFMQTEGRINTMIDLLPQLNINFDALTHESQKLYTELMNMEQAK